MGRRAGFALALTVAAVLGLTAERLVGQSGPWRRTATAAAADIVADHLGTHDAVVTGLARHFQEWEALVPEAMERSLRVFGERFSPLRRLLVADREGRVVAAFDTGAAPGAERRLVAGLDPSPARLRALVSRRAPYRAAVLEAGTVDRLELGAPILAPDGGLRGYVAADLELRSLCERLARFGASGGVPAALTDAEGRVWCAGPRAAPGSGVRVAAANGTTLWLRPPRWRQVAVPAGGGLLAALALVVLVAGRRRPAAAAPPPSDDDLG